MKKLLLALLSIPVLLGSVVARASSEQDSDRQNRIRVSYADNSSVPMALTLGNVLIFPVSEHGFSSWGAILAGYRRVSDSGRWAYGADFMYSSISETFLNQKIGTLQSYTLMPTVECYYIKKGIVRLYGSLSAGVGILDSYAHLAVQLNPIAIRVGSNKIAGFAELGFGTRGWINAGLEIGF